MSAFDTCLGCVDHAKDGVGHRVVVPRAKLTGGKKVETCSVEEDPFGHDSLQEFATALKEGDGAVCLCNLVIYFTRFGDGDHSCRMPGVMPEAYSGVEQGGEA